MMKSQRCLFLLLLIGAMAALSCRPAGQAMPNAPEPQIASESSRSPQRAAKLETGEPQKWALLVGVSTYDHLPASRHLPGAANDTRLLRRLLVDRYGFAADHITTLSEEKGAEHRPTRANIERAFRHLAETIRAGDQVVILLAGHGSRQPESDPPHPLFPEPDGMDEVFLPADVQKWGLDSERTPNAIVDDQIREWLEAISRKKAYTWIIFDCCHSGHMTRGSEIVREVPPEDLTPREEIRKARERAAKRRQTKGNKSAKPPAFISPIASEYLVALYACRPQETAPEVLCPPDSPDADYYGLLTYTLVQILEQSASSPMKLTYRELVQRIQSRHAGRPDGAPTPTLEGGGQDREILGAAQPIRPKFRLSRKGERYEVNAGDAHGLTRDSVLAVYSAPGTAAKAELLGHVRVTATQPFTARVQPCAYDGKPQASELPDAAPCQIVYTAYALHPFKVAVQAMKDDARAQKALKALKTLQESRAPLAEIVSDPRKAEWLLRPEKDASELIECSGNRSSLRLFPVEDERFAAQLRRRLEMAYRARALLVVAETTERELWRGQAEVDVKVEVVVRQGTEEKVVPRPAEGWVFRPGDEVRFRIHNKSPLARINVSLLIVNPEFDITSVYPKRYEVEKPLEPGREVSTDVFEIKEAPPFGQEYLVVIAEVAKGPPVDFSLLTQSGQERGDRPSSPLAQLLESAMDGRRDRGGLEPRQVGQHAMRVLSWRTEEATIKSEKAKDKGK